MMSMMMICRVWVCLCCNSVHCPCRGEKKKERKKVKSDAGREEREKNQSSVCGQFLVVVVVRWCFIGGLLPSGTREARLG